MSSSSRPEEATISKDKPLEESLPVATAVNIKGAGEAQTTKENENVNPAQNGRHTVPEKSSEDLIDMTSTPDRQVEGKAGDILDKVGQAGETTTTRHNLLDEQAPHDPMESSTATLKPDGKQFTIAPLLSSPSPEDQQSYLDPTPKTPLPSQPPSRSASNATSLPLLPRKDAPERSPTRSDAGFDDKVASEDEREINSRSEIQSIMDQFSEGDGLGQEEIMSPRLEIAGPLLGSPVQHPPRKSSLEPLNASMASASQSLQELRLSSSIALGHPEDDNDIGPPPPPKPGSVRSFPSPGRNQEDRFQSSETPMSPPLHRPPPPEPEPEPDLPFDFHRFLEQLRHKTADPVAKFLRSFLQEFGKKQWMVHEQVKIIGDFLAFITNKMGQCDVWREVSDAEFDNAREGMEKLVMNRLYTQTFSPAIPPPQPLPSSRPRKKGAERPMGPGRRGQHQEDVERDDILAQKVSIYGWIKEEHLDIPPVGDSGKRFLVLAQQGKL